jgi:putative membrane protein
VTFDPRRVLLSLSTAGALVLAGPVAAGAYGTTPSGSGPQVAIQQDASDNDNGATGDSRSASGVNSDEEFLEKVASGSATEVQVGQLAQARASDPEVRAFGERMVREHQLVMQQATSLAGSKQISVPTAPDTEEQASLVADLSTRSGSNFDRAYVHAMVEEHRADIAEFEAARTSLSSDVGSFTARTLPTLRAHLDEAEELADRLDV